MIDDVFQAMKDGRLNYQIVRFPPTGALLLDMRNGIFLGDLRVG